MLSLREHCHWSNWSADNHMNITERHLHETDCCFRYYLCHLQENARKCNFVQIWNSINMFVNIRKSIFTTMKQWLNVLWKNIVIFVDYNIYNSNTSNLNVWFQIPFPIRAKNCLPIYTKNFVNNNKITANIIHCPWFSHLYQEIKLKIFNFKISFIKWRRHIFLDHICLNCQRHFGLDFHLFLRVYLIITRR